MIHLDLFSGIGGFAYAADQVFGNVEHIFCDNEPLAQAVLRKHWPESYIFTDIRHIQNKEQIYHAITDTRREYGESGSIKATHRQTQDRLKATKEIERPGRIGLLTGGFPCQPFSAAGLRRGTADDRHLWPEMLRVIRLTAPEWVIAENVGGILTWNEGLVFEQVCTDLEAAGYEVQPFVIPAVAVDAPHRRDRVWFVANRTSGGRQRRRPQATAQEGHTARPEFRGELPGGLERPDSWNRDWTQVAAELCSVDDGLPTELGGLKLSKSQHRKEQLKAYGNAIVPQVAMEIMQEIFNQGVLTPEGRQS